MGVLRFEVVASCPDTGARAGILHTPHGAVETPVFMPVGTQAAVKGLTPRDLTAELGARIILGNAYHLYLRPGADTVKRLGGLHQFMNWPHAILTDSRGFQVFSLSDLRKVTANGVVFRSHLDGSQHVFTPESTVDTQFALGSDIAMVLDECLEWPVEEPAVRASMELTLAWAWRSFVHYRNQIEEVPKTTALFPIVQGSMYPNLRKECARRLLELEAEGYAIGGLSVGEPRDLSYEMTAASAAVLPHDRPRYVMGVGLPRELAEYVALGIDMMDCVLPSRNARNGCLFTSTGRVVIKNAQYKEDSSAIDPACRCYTCQNHTRAYLRHLFLAKEMTYSTLATLHNLHYYLDIMRGIRQAILSGRFPDFLRSVRSRSAADE